jgi:hypothetical protein
MRATSAETANPLFLLSGQRVRQDDGPGSVLPSGTREAAPQWVKSVCVRDLLLRKDESNYGLALFRTVMRWCLTCLKHAIKAQQLILFVRCEQDGPKEFHRTKE